jgi:hypothetical protein
MPARALNSLHLCTTLKVSPSLAPESYDITYRSRRIVSADNICVHSMGDDERRVKRSRFDQTEPEPRKPSRFDRRSRSPSSRHTNSRRSRSPIGKDPRSPTSSDKRSASIDPAAAAGKDHLSPSYMSGLTLVQSRSSCKDQCRASSEKGDSTCRRTSHSICENSRSSTERVLIRLHRQRARCQNPPLLPLAKAQATLVGRFTLPTVTISKILKSTTCAIAIH